MATPKDIKAGINTVELLVRNPKAKVSDGVSEAELENLLKLLRELNALRINKSFDLALPELFPEYVMTLH
jgi:hypothetical protein